MSWIDAWGDDAVLSVTLVLVGGVGEIGIVLRIDEKKVVAVHARPFDPGLYVLDGYVDDDYVEVTPGETDLYLSTVPYISHPEDTPSSTRFLDVLERAYDFESSLFTGGMIGSQSLPNLGTGIVNNSDDRQDYFQYLEWGGRQWDVFVGDQLAPFADFTLVWPGKTGRNVELFRDHIEIPLEDVAKRFDQPVQQNLYTPGFEPYVVFDGVNDYIDFGDVLNSGTATRAWGVAFRTTAASQQILYAKKTNLATGSAGYAIYLSPSSVVASISDGAQQAIASSAQSYADGKRHTIVSHHDNAAGELNLYFDGQLVDTVAATNVDSLNNTVNLVAGAQSNLGNLLTGEIERLLQGFTTPATAQAALDERYAGDVDASGLDHYVPLTENIGTTATDTSPTAANGTLTNGPTWSGLRNGRRELDGERVPLAYGDLTHRFSEHPGTTLGPPDPGNIHLEPDLLDSIKLVYRVHGGSIESVRNVEDGGVDLPEDTSATGDIFTGPGPTVGGTPPSNRYMTDLSRGLIRLAAPPERKVTCSILGDDAGGFTDEPHKILRRIAATHVGIPDPAGFETAKFDELNGAPAVGIFIRDDTISDVFFRLMHSMRGWWAIGRTGLITVDQLQPADALTPDAEVAKDDIVARSTKRIDVPAVHWRDKIAYAMNRAVQTEGELTPTLTPDLKVRFSKEWLFVSDDDEEIKTPFLLSEDVLTETLLSDVNGASSILSLSRSLFGVRREVWEMRLATGVLQFWIGDVIRFSNDVDRYGLGNRVFVVIGLRENVYKGLTLTLWG